MGPKETGMGRVIRLYPVWLALAGAAVAVALLCPYRSVPFERSDGELVKLTAPSRLNHTSDTWDYLQLGRQLESGRGFTSLFTYVPFLPESVGETNGENPGAFPMFWRQPGFPLMVAAGMAVGGRGNPDVLLWLAGVAVVLLPVGVYGLARLFVSPGWAAWAGLWTLFCPVALGGSAPLVATTWFAVFLVALVAAFLTANRPVAWLGTGILLGLTVLLRLETLILLPGLVVLHVLAQRRMFSAAIILVTAAVVMAPWSLRLATITGDPFYNVTSLVFHNTTTFPGWDSSRTLAVRDLSVIGFVGDHGGEVAQKALRNLARFLRDLVLLPSPLLAPFLWLAILRLPGEPRSRAFLIGGVVSVSVLILALSPMEYSPRFLAPVAPLLVVGAVMGLARLPRLQSVLAGAATVVGAAFLFGFLAGREPTGTAELAASDLNVLVSESDPGSRGEVALCDAPTLYAWIWDRPAVWAPVPRDVTAVRALLPGSFAMFTRATGQGDSLAEDLVDDYGAQGGRRSSTQLPTRVTWSEDSHDDSPSRDRGTGP